ncbi:MAG: hypothetical protein H7X94_10595 [Vallitaleaceae bacterium]|nr:hypothetical protein [Vallitaleaceae bacterium]
MNLIKLNEINSELQEAVNKVQEGQIIQKQLTNSRDSLSTLRNKLKVLEEQFRKEERDVEKLQSISFSNLLHSLINDKPEKLSEEEQEVLVVKVQMDRLQYEITAEVDRIHTLNEKLSKVVNSQESYEAIYQQKKAFIEIEMPDRWQEISKLALELEAMMLKQKEINEALSAGNRVVHCILGIESSLDSAEGWGTFDILGGGTLSTIIKRNHMSEAQNQINELTHLLTTYKQELGDIGNTIDINLGIDDFIGFADWFFDGFFVDLAVQSKIQEAIGQISDLKQRVESINNRLENENREIVDKGKAVKSQQDEIIQGI